jgi:hypothetical protein
VVKHGGVNVKGGSCFDAAAEISLFCHVDDVAHPTAEGGVGVRQQLVRLVWRDQVWMKMLRGERRPNTSTLMCSLLWRKSWRLGG